MGARWHGWRQFKAKFSPCICHHTFFTVGGNFFTYLGYGTLWEAKKFYLQPRKSKQATRLRDVFWLTHKYMLSSTIQTPIHRTSTLCINCQDWVLRQGQRYAPWCFSKVLILLFFLFSLSPTYIYVCGPQGLFFLNVWTVKYLLNFNVLPHSPWVCVCVCAWSLSEVRVT